MDEGDAERDVRLLLEAAVDRLEAAAELLRGPKIIASAGAMRLEIAVTRALDAISGACRS